MNAESNTLDIINNGERYSVTIQDFFRENNYILYIVKIIDQCFNSLYCLCFRYKSLKKMHENLFKEESLKLILPEFPKTRSFFFMNKTNKNTRNIKDRAR